MPTLLLVNIVGTARKFRTRPFGLYHMILTDGDYGWVNGLKLQETKFSDPNYKRLSELLHRESKPGEPYFMLRDELKPLGKFPIAEGFHIVLCEAWS